MHGGRESDQYGILAFLRRLFDINLAAAAKSHSGNRRIADGQGDGHARFLRRLCRLASYCPARIDVFMLAYLIFTRDFAPARFSAQWRSLCFITLHHIPSTLIRGHFIGETRHKR